MLREDEELDDDLDDDLEEEEEETECPNCGQETGGASACPNCGAILFEDDDSDPFSEDDDFDEEV